MKTIFNKFFPWICTFLILITSLNFNSCEYKTEYIRTQKKTEVPEFARNEKTKTLPRHYLPHELYYSSDSYRLKIDLKLAYYGDYVDEDFKYIKLKPKHHPKVIGICAHFAPKHRTPKYTILVSFGGLDTFNCSSESVKFFRRFVNYVSFYYGKEFVQETQFIVIDWLRLVLSDDRKRTFAFQIVNYYTGNVKKRDIVIPAVSTAAFINKLHRVGIIPSMSDSAAYGVCIGGLNIALASLFLKCNLKIVVINGSPFYRKRQLKNIVDNSINKVETSYIVISGKKDIIFNPKHGERLSKFLSNYSADVKYFNVMSSHQKLVMSYYFTAVSLIVSSLLNKDRQFVYMDFKKYPELPKSFNQRDWNRYVMYDSKLHSKYEE